jgi:hypothetical protein
MELSDLDASPWGRRGRSCAVHGWGCPNQVAPAQGPSSSSRQGEEEGREEEDDEHRITHLHWSTGPTPRTTGTSDRAVITAFTNLVDPRCTTTVATGASIHRSRPVGLWYAVGSVESVWKPGAPTSRPLRRPVWQRSCAWVLGLDGRAKPLSIGDRRRGVAPRKWRSRSGSAPKEQIQWRSKRESTRPRDDRAFNTVGANRANGIGEGATVEAKWWANRVNPNATVRFPRLYPFRLTLGPTGLTGHSGHRLGLTA